MFDLLNLVDSAGGDTLYKMVSVSELCGSMGRRGGSAVGFVLLWFIATDK